MLAIPDEKDHRVKFADWMELKAIASPEGRVGFGTLISAAILTENEQDEDIGEQDAEEDDLVRTTQEEILRRLNSVGDGYPFRIDEKGRALTFVEPLAETGVIYLFCLYLTHVSDHTIIVKKRDAPRVNDRTRDLFQACSTVAAAGYVKGTSRSFGWPRGDGSGFLEALKRVYKEFGDGKPHDVAREGASQHVKDDGVDVIAWRKEPDNLPGNAYLIGQVASGGDWKGKGVKAIRNRFHNFWFSEIPAAQPQDAIFIPFSLEPPILSDSTTYHDTLKGYISYLSYELGDIVYRDRVARNFGEGLQISKGGHLLVERCNDLPKIERWVNRYSKRLQLYGRTA